ncbi:MAG: hypothetical protein LDLANPLL_02547 [Turneriella sp.]|nr:hypothetical protein [Turneriella sp.]
MTAPVVSTTALWGIAIQISAEAKFPSILIREIYRRLASQEDKWGFSIESIMPDIFPGENLSEEAIDSAYKYLIRITYTKSKAELKKTLAALLKGVSGITKIGLGEILQKSPDVTSSSGSERNESETGIAEFSSVQRRQGSMRVDLAKIEDLVNLIGELIINKNQVDALSNSIVGWVEKAQLQSQDKSQLSDFQSAKSQLSYVTGKLRDLALGIRMVPIGQALKKYPAAVREMARKQQKEIRVILEGEETELDKAILEEIADPLLHMIRNSVDHGIESPNVREKNGKAREGTLLIRAEHEGDRIAIFVEDDGAGLNTGKILQKAVQKGIVSGKNKDLLSEREIFHLIFAPGFSTADKVSELSGRGVGMDVVKNNIQRLNGTVDVESAEGVGTRITLKLPLTLSILEGLLLEDAEQRYAIPLIAIEKAYQVDPVDLKRVGRYWLIEKNGVTLPVFRIAELFHNDTQMAGTYYLIEASASGGKFGLMVQKILGRQEIVLKPLGDYLGKVKGISGTTILGDGHVALILDTKTIADSVANILHTPQAEGVLNKEEKENLQEADV